MTQATAQAHPNIALVKYWGKRDTALNLPATGSVSMTLDVFPTTTTVQVDASAAEDEFILNDVLRDGVPAERTRRFLDIVRAMAGTDARARVTSHNTVPSAAGLASSASGFAALAGAAAAAYGLDLDDRQLSRLARRGSGSAARSIFGGFALWHAGDDEESFAEPLAAPADLAMVVTIVDAGEKQVSSREAMRRTALTSPYYPAWVSSTEQSLAAAQEAFRDADVARIGRITETNALRMHAAIQGSDPSIRYLSPTSVAIFDRVEQLRAEGLTVFATADAGPNVVALCLAEEAPAVDAALAAFAETVIAHPGPGLRLVAEGEQ
ncbi:diphosphomevalonate decarboxylase [Microbacterium sp. NPDC089189]|uniref:diphosphomevalonate decarboxylase n=1 Tax=Microbacterium sp. NPDC089189 TaxID=3154972 RepID=UPI003444DE3C